mmetsp:Transcript_6165/g.15814  ORF Transcript_6165/g.15814 Transcript_6165/m.15814 type:complete len:829 (-) Transcript_6165:82-2568(-)|eukprot:CAMPEP_0182916590 /NCGR_PEP_ID=MMETSP0105_2-20130417/1037_1 /TAXON_ID=81532 ORGANISM="Acanthoeca-like sp., Strain 10tr" /NCGR_SAMPLE_ID=MMETSP0105_2 /ASSEMBLY_ACC=CAM_ASM_000205 /LENGTH=828 /DNA_ID=CAMNT_0025053555 /DNA_START=61 /DNA_END=2547 /DNA_ORIENTATION=-
MDGRPAAAAAAAPAEDSLVAAAGLAGLAAAATKAAPIATMGEARPLKRTVSPSNFSASTVTTRSSSPPVAPSCEGGDPGTVTAVSAPKRRRVDAVGPPAGPAPHTKANGAESMPTPTALDVLALVDVGGSAPNYLPKLRAYCRELITALQIASGDGGHRIGLIPFGTSVGPITALGSSTVELEAGIAAMGPDRGVQYGPPLEAARAELARNGAHGSVPVVLLETAGANSDRGAAVAAARALVGEGANVIAIAVGAGTGDVAAVTGEAGGFDDASKGSSLVRVVANHDELVAEAAAVAQMVRCRYEKAADKLGNGPNAAVALKTAHAPAANRHSSASAYDPEKLLKLPRSTARVCAHCGDRARCACPVCYSVLYCNRECQVKHYPMHKPDCARRQGGAPSSQPEVAPTQSKAALAQWPTMTEEVTCSTAQPKVFVSYAAQEGRYIYNAIAFAMVERGFDVFDPAQQDASAAEIQQAIAGCDVFLAVLSPAYFASKTCLRAAHHAMTCGLPVTAVNDDDACPYTGDGKLRSLEEHGRADTEEVRAYLFGNGVLPVISAKDQIGVVRSFLAALKAQYHHPERRWQPHNFPPQPTRIASIDSVSGKQSRRASSHLVPRMYETTESAADVDAEPSRQMSGPDLARLMLMVNENQLTREQAVLLGDNCEATVSEEAAISASTAAALSAAVAAATATAAAEEAASRKEATPSRARAKGASAEKKARSRCAQTKAAGADANVDDDSWLESVPPPPSLEVPPGGWKSVDDMIKSAIPVEALGLDRKRFNRWKRVHGVSFRGDDQKALTRIRRAELARLHARVARQQKRLKNYRVQEV